jgi:hypothetical protein
MRAASSSASSPTTTANGYVTPDDVLAGRQKAVLAERDRWLEEARDRPAQRRAEKREGVKAAWRVGSRKGLGTPPSLRSSLDRTATAVMFTLGQHSPRRRRANARPAS